MYTDTITLYNSVYNKSTGDNEYYPTVFENVEVQKTQGANISETGLSNTDKAKLFIKMENLPKPYLRPKEWSKETDKSKLFTLTPNASDFFVIGNIVDTSKDYEEMDKVYDDVYKITTVDVYDKVIPHFEVGGV